MRVRIQIVIAALLLIMILTSADAEVTSPYSGTVVIQTKKPFLAYVKTLKSAINVNKMGIVAEACATCGAKSIGMEIPGNRVIMIFNPHFAVRMLKASTAAGVEAPLRLYLTENPDGTAKLSYRLPSHVFAPYEVPALNEMAKELDEVIEAIIAKADQE